MIFNTQCFYTSLTHFFFDSIRSTCTCIRCLHFLKFDHACILVHHGVPTATFGSFHKAEKLPERHEGENAGKTRDGAMNSGHIVEFRSQTLSVYGGHHYQIRTCIPKCVWYLSVILIYDDIINNKSWDRRWGLGRTISRNGMREEEIHVSMCTIYMSRLIKSSGSKYFNY